MKREFDPCLREWMDVEQPVSPALQRDLQNLVTLNRWFGSHALVLDFMRRWLHPGRAWRILDLATGSGDIPRAIADWAQKNGRIVRIDAVDMQSSTLEIARKESRAHPHIHYHVADIRTFSGPEPWDVVLCSLALHHFSEEDAVRVLRTMRALATRHALVADLRRSLPATVGVDLLTAVWMREPMTKNDARLSVRRAFSFDEFSRLAERAGWTNFFHERRFCFRQALWLSRS